MDDFWSNILRRATDCGHGRLSRLLCQSKISNLDSVDVVGCCQQQVLQLQVSMYYTPAPQYCSLSCELNKQNTMCERWCTFFIHFLPTGAGCHLRQTQQIAMTHTHTHTHTHTYTHTHIHTHQAICVMPRNTMQGGCSAILLCVMLCWTTKVESFLHVKSLQTAVQCEPSGLSTQQDQVCLYNSFMQLHYTKAYRMHLAC